MTCAVTSKVFDALTRQHEGHTHTHTQGSRLKVRSILRGVAVDLLPLSCGCGFVYLRSFVLRYCTHDVARRIRRLRSFIRVARCDNFDSRLAVAIKLAGMVKIPEPRGH